jgi:hypothetical protein
LTLAIAQIATPVVVPSAEATATQTELAQTRLLAQADADTSEDRGGRLESRYAPREPEKKSWYNGSYIFGITRSVAGSTISPAGKAPLFVLTVPLDLAILPFAIIGGLFG